jgi:hypothetical protein
MGLRWRMIHLLRHYISRLWHGVDSSLAVTLTSLIRQQRVILINIFPSAFNLYTRLPCSCVSVLNALSLSSNFNHHHVRPNPSNLLS